jgi:hypothetical protein
MYIYTYLYIHYQTFQVFLIYFLKCPSSPVMQSYAPNVDVEVTNRKSK